jgi:hypothetical protein
MENFIMDGHIISRRAFHRQAIHGHGISFLLKALLDVFFLGLRPRQK